MIYRISGFDEGPHWDAALIEAESQEVAVAILTARLEPDKDGLRPDGVWTPQPSADWYVTQAVEPLCFILGAGCRD